METNTNQRRIFLKNLGLGAATLSMPITGKAAWSVRDDQPNKSETVHFRNGFDFEFKFAGEHFLGLGVIKSNGICLRSSHLPMFVQVSTPEAIELVNYKLIDKLVTSDEITLSFSVRKQLGNTMEWMLHTVRNRRNMSDWTKEPEDAPGTKIMMKIKPVERKIGATIVKGFSYQYLFSSDSLEIYKITDRSSWEIGGSAIGNEFWMRNGVVECIKSFSSLSDFYSTEWYLPNIANPNIFQFHPFQTHLQGFTFTVAKEGTLLTWSPEVGHIRSLFEKWRGYDQIVHFHEHCNDLYNEFSSSPIEVLWIPGELNHVERANLYYNMRELVHEQLHNQAGIRRERITSYGLIEEWKEPDFDHYTERGLPKLIEAGVKTVFIPNQCQNDMNTWGVSNMCCNVDFKISETVGEDKLKRFCKKAGDNGICVEMWGNTAISTLTERFMHHEGRKKGIDFLPYKGSIMEVIDKAESPFIRNASNAIEADHYTPRFCALNLRDKTIREYWMKQWSYFHDEIGIGGIFLDSSFNMSSDKFHHAQFDGTKSWAGATLDQQGVTGKYRPLNEPPKLIHTQYHAHLSLVADMQKAGYRYCGEDMGVFGINRTGPGLVERVSSLSLWSDCYCPFDQDALKKAGFDPMTIFFKGLAYQMVWWIRWMPKTEKLDLGIDDPRAFKLIKVFNDVIENMYNREILPDEKAVMYRRDNTSILWAFDDVTVLLKEGVKVKDMKDGSVVELADNSNLRAKKLNVYKIIQA